jgi:flagellar assembly factor FliW
MRLTTKSFGEIDVSNEDIIHFSDGLPGFYDYKDYVILSADEEDGNDMFCWLQSVDDGELAFVMLCIRKFMPDYCPRFDKDVLEGLEDGNPLEYFGIAVVPEDVQQMRVNLKAPVVINKRTGIGRQVLALNEEYDLRHKVFREVDEECSAEEDRGQVTEC